MPLGQWAFAMATMKWPTSAAAASGVRKPMAMPPISSAPAASVAQSGAGRKPIEATTPVQRTKPGPPATPSAFWAPWPKMSRPTAKRMTRSDSDRSTCRKPPVPLPGAAYLLPATPVGTGWIGVSPSVPQITPEMTIAAVTERWPETARIFARYGLGCASCAISKSESVLQGATGHGGGRVNVDDLLRDLNTFADTGKLPNGLPDAAHVAPGGGMRAKGMAEQKGIKQVIAVMSGKGGVGKSLVAGLLAVGLRRRGLRVGVLDGDITGPSIPRMFGVKEKPGVAGPNTLQPPLSRGGIPIMSMNLLLPGEEEAVIWRGPMVSGAIRQFFSDVAWGELDYLIVDLPPGTSDAPLTVMQALPIAGVVLVTTPQALATMVVTKAVRLVKQLGGDIFGVVENMSYVTMPDGSRNEVFGPSQGLKLVIAANAPLLANIPIDPEIARAADTGEIEQYMGKEADELVDNFLAVAPEKHPQQVVA